ELAALKGAIVFPFNLPPILGLGNTGGFQYVLEAQQDQPPADLAAALRGLTVAANQQPELAGVYTTYSADTPQVYIEAEAPFRDRIGDIYRIYVRNAAGAMVPLRALVKAKLVQGPQAVVRYNGFRSAVVNGAPKPPYSSGQALAAMARISAATLPTGYGFEWTGTAFQEQRQDGTHSRPCRDVRLSFPGCALRELEHSRTGAALGQRRGPRRARGARIGGSQFRGVYADRACRADRSGREERHSHRGFRRRAARPGERCRDLRDRRGEAALPTGDDDELRLHSGAPAVGHRARRRRGHPAGGGDAGLRWHDRRSDLWHFHHSASLCDGRASAPMGARRRPESGPGPFDRIRLNASHNPVQTEAS